MRTAPALASAVLVLGLTKASLAQPPPVAGPPSPPSNAAVAVHPVSPTTGSTRGAPTTKPPAPQTTEPRAALPPAIVVHAPDTGSAAAPVKVHWVTRAVRAVAGAGLQAGGTLIGLGEKALGRHAPNVTGPYDPVEVKDPNGARQLVVFRSNQPKTAEDIGTFVDLARQRGVTDRSQILFVNLRAEKDEDTSLISQYEASLGPSAGSGRIKQLDVKIIDNSPPALYVGNLGWQKAVGRVRAVYNALQDPSIKVAVIHCEEGDGRTGEIVATAVRIAMDNMSEKDALAEAEQHELTMPWQRAFVSRFAREWHDGTIRF